MQEKAIKKTHQPYTGNQWSFYHKLFSPASRCIQSPIYPTKSAYIGGYIRRCRRWFSHKEKQRKRIRKGRAI
jgi:hypothetical protein